MCFKRYIDDYIVNDHQALMEIPVDETEDDEQAVWPFTGQQIFSIYACAVCKYPICRYTNVQSFAENEYGGQGIVVAIETLVSRINK